MHVELETARLRLRRWREEDLDPLHDFYRDPSSARLFGDGVTRHDVWRRIAVFLGHWQLRGFGLWALEERTGAVFVGYAGLWYPPAFADVEVGWGIVARHRGKGYAQEAARRALSFGYGELGLARLVSYVRPDNTASMRVAERLGARPDGEFSLRDKPHIIYLHPRCDATSGASTREKCICH
jgi:RimJ/RimL family protein N-acetyltransferase